MPIITEKKNLFKDIDKFRCVHEVHRHFKSQMSAYHILIEKNCFPNGCMYFQWKCRLLAKQRKCFRNFKNVGKECFNCKYFYEDKIHQYPEFIDSDVSLADFELEFDEFVEWIHQLKNKRVLCEGRITSIRPDLSVNFKQNSYNITLGGFLIHFSSGYIDNIPFDDPFYLSVSSLTQNKIRFRKDDVLEFEASLFLDKGRFVFRKSGKFHFIERGNEKAPNRSDLLVSLSTATVQQGQPSKCLNCSQGILADNHSKGSGPKRSVICMIGTPDYQLCNFMDDSSKGNSKDICANPEWSGKKCHYTI